MSRFSVIYQVKKQFHQIACETQVEAQAVLHRLYAKKKKTPIGIYDAKTELFFWEPSRQRQFDKLPLPEQGKLGNEMIATAQLLRDRDGHHNEIALQPDILQRPVYSIPD